MQLINDISLSCFLKFETNKIFGFSCVDMGLFLYRMF